MSEFLRGSYSSAELHARYRHLIDALPPGTLAGRPMTGLRSLENGGNGSNPPTAKFTTFEARTVCRVLPDGKRIPLCTVHGKYVVATYAKMTLCDMLAVFKVMEKLATVPEKVIDPDGMTYYEEQAVTILMGLKYAIEPVHVDGQGRHEGKVLRGTKGMSYDEVFDNRKLKNAANHQDWTPKIINRKQFNRKPYVHKTIEEEQDIFFQICARQGYIEPWCPEACYAEYAQGFTIYMETGILPNRFCLLKGKENDFHIRPAPSDISTRRSRVIWFTKYCGNYSPALWKGLHIALNQNVTPYPHMHSYQRDVISEWVQPLMPKVQRYLGKHMPAIKTKELEAEKVADVLPIMSKQQRKRYNRKIRQGEKPIDIVQRQKPEFYISEKLKALGATLSFTQDGQGSAWEVEGQGLRDIIVNYWVGSGIVNGARNLKNSVLEGLNKLMASIKSFWESSKEVLINIFGGGAVAWLCAMGCVVVALSALGLAKLVQIFRQYRDSYQFQGDPIIEAEGQSFGSWVGEGFYNATGIKISGMYLEKKFLDLGRYKNSLQAIEWFIERMKDLLDYSCLKLTGKHLFESNAHIKTLLEAIETVQSLEGFNTSEQKELFLSHYRYCVTHATKALSKPCYSDIQRFIHAYNDKYIELLGEKRGQQRIKPVCVAFVGSSSVGKSYMMQVMTKILAREYKKISDAHPYDVYSRNGADDYWSAYKNHFGIIYDDFLQIKDESKRGQQALELINVVNTNPYACNMASLHDKGCTYVESPFVGVTSNDLDHQNLGIMLQEALTNRYAFVVKLTRTGPYKRKPSTLEEISEGIRFEVKSYDNGKAVWKEITFKYLIESIFTHILINKENVIPDLPDVVLSRVEEPLEKDVNIRLQQPKENFSNVSFESSIPASVIPQKEKWNILSAIKNAVVGNKEDDDERPESILSDFPKKNHLVDTSKLTETPIINATTTFVSSESQYPHNYQLWKDLAKNFRGKSFFRPFGLAMGSMVTEYPEYVFRMFSTDIPSEYQFMDPEVDQFDDDPQARSIQAKYLTCDFPKYPEKWQDFLLTHYRKTAFYVEGQMRSASFQRMLEGEGIHYFYWKEADIYFIRILPKKAPWFFKRKESDYKWIPMFPSTNIDTPQLQDFVKNMSELDNVDAFYEELIYNPNPAAPLFVHPFLSSISAKWSPRRGFAVVYHEAKAELIRRYMSQEFISNSSFDEHIYRRLTTSGHHIDMGIPDLKKNRSWIAKVKQYTPYICTVVGIVSAVATFVGVYAAYMGVKKEQVLPSSQSDDSVHEHIRKKHIGKNRPRSVMWVKKEDLRPKKVDGQSWTEENGVVIHVEGQGFNEKAARIYRNLRHIAFCKNIANGDAMRVCSSYTLFVGGRTCLIPYHLHAKDWDFVRVTHPTNPDNYFERPKEDIIITEDPELENKEHVLYTFKYGDTFRDILQMFPTSSRFRPTSLMALSYKVADNKVLPIIYAGKDVSVVDIKINGEYDRSGVGAVQMFNQAGECGRVYLNPDNVDHESIEGIHVAGFKDISFFARITRELLERLIKVDIEVGKHKDPQFSIAKDVPGQSIDLGFVDTLPSQVLPGLTHVGKLSRSISAPQKSSYEPSFLQHQDDCPFQIVGHPAHAFEASADKSLRKRIGVHSPPMIPEMEDPRTFEGIFREDIVSRIYYDLTEEEAILGTRALPLMAKTKSSGGGFMHFNKKRTDVIDYENGKMKDVLRSPYNELRADWEKGIKTNVYAVGCYKTDEVISKEKYDKGFIRMFFIMCLWVNLLTKQIFGCLQEQLTGAITSDAAIGVNPYSNEWKYTYLHLISNGKGRVDASDASGWDQRFSFHFVHCFLNFIKKYWVNLTTSQFNLISCCLHTCLSPWIVIKDQVYQTHGMMPSGWWGTSIFNTIMHSWKRRVIFYVYANHYHIDLMFSQVCRLKVHGDDAVQVINPPDGYIDIFSGYTSQWIAKASELFFACSHTNFKKDGEPEDVTIEECEFLKRKFVVQPDKNVFCPLSLESIHKMLLWTRRGQIPFQTQFIVNAHTALRELYFHSRPVYEVYQKLLNKFLERIAFHSQFFTSYSQLQKLFSESLEGGPPLIERHIVGDW